MDVDTKGKFLLMFLYTSQKYVSIDEYDNLKEKEFQYRRKMKNACWKGFNDRNPYTEKYGYAMDEKTGRLIWKVQIDGSSGVTQKVGRELK